MSSSPIALQDAIIWPNRGSCQDEAKLHLPSVCTRHLTTALGLCGKRRRPCSAAGCSAEQHPPPEELVRLVERACAAARPELRLHVSEAAPPACLVGDSADDE